MSNQELKQELDNLEAEYSAHQKEAKRLKTEIDEKKSQLGLLNLGFKSGDIVKNHNGIYKLTKYQFCCFYGHAKTKNGWHKIERAFYGKAVLLTDDEIKRMGIE